MTHTEFDSVVREFNGIAGDGYHVMVFLSGGTYFNGALHSREGGLVRVDVRAINGAPIVHNDCFATVVCVASIKAMALIP